MKKKRKKKEEKNTGPLIYRYGKTKIHINITTNAWINRKMTTLNEALLLPTQTNDTQHNK